MHICYLCNEYPPDQLGGIGSVTQTLAHALVTRGHQVSVVGVYPKARAGLENDQGVTVFRLPHASFPYTGLVVNGTAIRRALIKLHNEFPIDVIEGPENSLAILPHNFPASKIIRLHGGHRFLAATLSTPIDPWRGWLEKRSFRRADHLCAVSHYVAETTRALLGLDNRPIQVLPNPVNTNIFRPQPEIPEIPGLIMFVGTVSEKKGVRQLVQAMRRITVAFPAAKLWVVGRDGRDPQTGASFIAKLKQQIPPALMEQIVFKGAVEHSLLPQLLAQASVCVYPSHMEALGLAALEGQAMGKAVVASRVGPGTEVVEDQVSGLLCDPHDSDSIAEKVLTLLENDELRKRLGEQARQRVIKYFSIEQLAGRNENFYGHCIQGNHSGKL